MKPRSAGDFYVRRYRAGTFAQQLKEASVKMNKKVTHTLGITDLVANEDGTVTVKSSDLHKLVSTEAPKHIVVASPPMGPGSPGHPLPAPTPPIITIIWEF
jgi:hypothetical protein